MPELVSIKHPLTEVDLSIVSSLLDEALIPYFVKNSKVQDLFGLGRIGTGFNLITGPMIIQVKNEHFQTAKEIVDYYFLKLDNDIKDPELEIISVYNKSLNISILLGIFLPGLGIIHLIKALKYKLHYVSLLRGDIKLYFSTIIFILGFVLDLSLIYNYL